MIVTFGLWSNGPTVGPEALFGPFQTPGARQVAQQDGLMQALNSTFESALMHGRSLRGAFS